MWPPNFKWRRVSDCEHEQVQTSVAAGLQRKVCLVCGHVAIVFVEDVVDTTWLERQSVSESSTTSS
jgi:hypothetical protein